MASQKWIVFFAFLALSVFMEEATIYPTCKQQIITQLMESINALENCNCSGKSINGPVKVKWVNEHFFHNLNAWPPYEIFIAAVFLVFN